MADIIPEEILVKGKRPETFSGGLYGLGGAPGGGGTSGTGIGGLYGLAGPGSYATLARLGAEDEFRMKGVTDAPSLEQRQIEAAQKYANLVKSFPTTAEDIRAVQDAKDELVALGVTREQIAATGVDASGGISGVMGASASGMLDAAGQKVIDLIGAGGQKFSDIITGGAGPDVAQTLLDPISILTGGFGGTINYGDSGKTTPLILGKTSATGMPVGLSLPDPRAIRQEGLFPWIFNNAGLGGIAGLAGPAAAAAGGNTLDSTLTGDGVGLSGASLIAAAALDKDSDAVKTGARDIIAGGGGSDSSTIKTGARDIIAGGGGSDSPVIKTGARNIVAGGGGSDSPVIKTGARNIVAGGGGSDSPVIKTGARNIATGGGGSDSPVIKTGTMSDAELDVVLADLGGLPAVKGGYDTPPIKTSSPAIKTGGASSSGGSDGVTPEQIINQGMSAVKTEKAGLADITNTYDPSLSLAENMALMLGTKTQEEDAVNSALMYGGGIVQPTDINAKISRILGNH